MDLRIAWSQRRERSVRKCLDALDSSTRESRGTARVLLIMLPNTRVQKKGVLPHLELALCRFNRSSTRATPYERMATTTMGERVFVSSILKLDQRFQAGDVKPKRGAEGVTRALPSSRPLYLYLSFLHLVSHRLFFLSLSFSLSLSRK